MNDSAAGAAAGAWGIPGWAKVLLIAAITLMAAGVVAPMAIKAPASNMSGAAAMSNSLAAGSPGEQATAPAWSPAMFRVGFSFFVGFVIAYALRSFLKMALVAAGFMALLLFGLQYAGLIEVHWNAMERQYDAGSGWLHEQTRSFAAFIQGALPSGGASAGLARFPSKSMRGGCAVAGAAAARTPTTNSTAAVADIRNAFFIVASILTIARHTKQVYFYDQRSNAPFFHASFFHTPCQTKHPPPNRLPNRSPFRPTSAT